ncbi:CPBP family intramembrane metalloprotease [Virgibacillus phasianinus]|uniref:CPBP family intramembrane metalloprotease n=1 Tax=Virgibacillus phasianinus TaxID=2017483 RepID=A0A220U4V5_9BACI|nr:CPBP family intramembrane glutamic endopeptidase [Virgibacillus phasianinus]ASK63314.1 CPBP family intramembrane metalloprotease [Virgibacillus phasianinus]
MRKQSDIIKQLSDHDLKVQLIISQLVLIFIGFFLSNFLFDSLAMWMDYLTFSIFDVLYYGVIPGILIVLFDLACMYTFPKKHYDDGGINERIFSNLSVGEIFFLTLLISIAEELLFRGVLQTSFGYSVASLLFALVHFRYLQKPVLLVSILFVSFYIGYIFVLTESLLVTIVAHFMVDFILGLVIRFQKRGAKYD